MGNVHVSPFMLIAPGTKVRDVVTGVTGEVTAVHVRRATPPAYLIEYVNAVGSACAVWMEEDRLEPATTRGTVEQPLHGTPDGGPRLDPDGQPIDQGGIGELANPNR